MRKETILQLWKGYKIERISIQFRTHDFVGEYFEPIIDSKIEVNNVNRDHLLYFFKVYISEFDRHIRYGEYLPVGQEGGLYITLEDSNFPPFFEVKKIFTIDCLRKQSLDIGVSLDYNEVLFIKKQSILIPSMALNMTPFTFNLSTSSLNLITKNLEKKIESEIIKILKEYNHYPMMSPKIIIHGFSHNSIFDSILKISFSFFVFSNSLSLSESPEITKIPIPDYEWFNEIKNLERDELLC